MRAVDRIYVRVCFKDIEANFTASSKYIINFSSFGFFGAIFYCSPVILNGVVATKQFAVHSRV